MQRYIFIYIKNVLGKNIFMCVICAISNSYGLHSAKMRRADGKTASGFRTISAKSAKNRTPATLRKRAFFGNQLKIKQLRKISV